MAREIRIQIFDEKNTYRIYVEKHLFKPMKVFAFIVDEYETGAAAKGRIVEAKVSASTLKEEIEFWLHALKRYVVKKRHQKSC